MHNGDTMQLVNHSTARVNIESNARPPRPKSLAAVPENIPEELKRISQWVTWRSEFRDGKWTKPPYQVNGEDRASSTDSAMWGLFKKCVEDLSTRANRWRRVCSLPEHDVIGIDLDHCFDLKSSKGEQWSLDIIQRMNSYTEFSPSGEGVRIFVKGTYPTDWRVKKATSRSILPAAISRSQAIA
jgi:primase-polymerase (primpol)-like protein